MKRNSIKTLICLALIVAGMGSATAQTLKFNAKKTLKIVQFTDVHW